MNDKHTEDFIDYTGEKEESWSDWWTRVRMEEIALKKKEED